MGFGHVVLLICGIGMCMCLPLDTRPSGTNRTKSKEFQNEVGSNDKHSIVNDSPVISLKTDHGSLPLNGSSQLPHIKSENTIDTIFIDDDVKYLNCHLKPVTPHLYEEITELLKYQAKLVEYIFTFKNHTDNPMLVNAEYTYKANQWARVSHSHGLTILSLAFNYGILSLMTLSFGVVTKPIELEEEPYGCILKLNEYDRIQVMLYILLRDFQPDGEINVYEGEAVCHQMIKNEDGFAKFTDQCCYKKLTTGDIICTIDSLNKWLKILETLIAVFTLVVFLFAPILLTKFFYAQTLNVVRYIVKLKEPMYKTICVCRGTPAVDVMSTFVLDFRHKKHFYRCKNLTRQLPENTIIPVKIDEYDILVNYAKLLPENNVPVGILSSVSNAIFMCKLNELEAFQDCCEANLFGCFRETDPFPWFNMCTLIGRVFLVLFMPMPFYVRLACYYMFENPEVMARTDAAANVGLPVAFDYKLMQFLTPIHPIFITIYIIYFITGMTFAIVSTSKKKSHFHKIVTDSLKDLLNISWLSSFEMMIKNILWPFKKMGMFGFFIGLIYWPIVLPLCLVVCILFCVPLIFFSFRLLCHSLGIASTDDPARQQHLPGELKQTPTGMQLLEANELIDNIAKKSWRNNRLTRQLNKVGIPRMMLNCALALVCIATVLAATLMFTEVAWFILNICIFTMMGLIVNARKVLKYGTLIVLVILYSYDCFNDVYKQYLKLNKALFGEIKGRIKDIMEVTSLPSHLQENMGFKAVEVSEQADYEADDDISQDKNYHWIINDLVLFVDNDDFPRIPKKLFEDVCQIKVPGSPGPVYLSLLCAAGKFVAIIVFLVFVFIVVLSFGTMYQVSGTNQMLATMAGGFAPMMFSKVLKPASPDIELGSVSFKSKLEEIITNFWQIWPMFDLPIELEEKEEEEEGDDESDNDDKKKDDTDKKDKKKDKDNNDKKSKKQSTIGRISPSDLTAVDQSFNEDEIKNKLAEMKSVRPANGQFVDVVIILPEKDIPDEEWLKEWSSISEFGMPMGIIEPNCITITDDAIKI